MVKAYIIVLNILILIFAGVIFLLRKKEKKIARSITNLLICAAVTISSNLIFVVSKDINVSTIGFSMFSASIDWLLIFLWKFVELDPLDKDKKERINRIFCSLAVVDGILLMTNVFWGHEFMLKPAMLLDKYRIYEVTEQGIFYYLHLLFSYVIVLRILYVLIKRIRTTSRIYRNKYAVVLFLFLIVIVLDGIIVLIRNPLNISIMFYGALAIAISYYMIYYQPKKLIIDMQTVILNNLKNGILFFDDKQNCIYANDTLCKWIGVKNDLKKVEKIVKEKSNANNIHDQEYTTWYENVEINGELKNYKVECHNIYDEKNIYVGCCINVSDNTQLKKYYEMEVNIAKNANKAKTDFLSRVSHDIRTPVNSISGMNEMILRECKDKKIMEYAYQISESAEILLNLINNVLDFTKIESGKMTLVNREYDTRRMLEGIVDIIAIQAGKKKIDFICNISPDIPAKLYGDDVRISQIIMNLLSNAIKYTSEGSVTLTVNKLQSSEEISEIYVSVKDTGMGIKKEDISKLFNAFERFEEVKNHSIQGSGLGLNIVAYFLRMMNSNLDVKSEYGKGSDFSFVVNQKIADETPIGKFDKKVQSVEDYQYHELFTAPDAKILVVDDNEINRFVFVSLLGATKVQVDEAESGIKCLEMTKKEKYHMIFMDHMMPEMDGIETFHKIKEDENNLCRDIPIIALTANAIEGARQMYLDEGFNAYLTKPFEPEDVEKLILDCLPKELIEKNGEN